MILEEVQLPAVLCSVPAEIAIVHPGLGEPGKGLWLSGSRLVVQLQG